MEYLMIITLLVVVIVGISITREIKAISKEVDRLDGQMKTARPKLAPEKSEDETSRETIVSDLGKFALMRCVDIFDDYDHEEVEKLPPSVLEAWRIGMTKSNMR